MNNTTKTEYKCYCCNYTASQRSHLSKHLKTTKHIQNRNILILKLQNMSDNALKKLYGTSTHSDIISSFEGLNIKFVLVNAKQNIMNIKKLL